MTDIHSPELETAIKAAKAGAAISLSYYENGIEFALKEDKTIITKADPESERVIIDEIKSAYPETNFLAEESGGSMDHDEFWIIDPIDGTRSFSRGVPVWNILIALCRKGEIVLGLSYFPVLNQIIYAEKGKGAYVNGNPVHVSDISPLSAAYLGTGSPRHFKNKHMLIDLTDASGTLRIHDLNFTNYLIAKGSMDGVVDAYGMTWDLAPHKVIIEEAGGRITRLNGDEWKVDENRGCVISNGLIHDELLDITKKYY